MEQQTPIPSQIKDEAPRRVKTRHFPILDLGGGGGGGGGGVGLNFFFWGGGGGGGGRVVGLTFILS